MKSESTNEKFLMSVKHRDEVIGLRMEEVKFLFRLIFK